MTLKRVGDFLLYITIGMLVAFAAIWFASRSDGTETELIGKWAGLVATTLILFGYAIKAHKRFVRKKSFRVMTLSLLAVHVSVFAVVLLKVEHWKVLWFVLTYPVENIAIDWALSLSGHNPLQVGQGRPFSKT